MPPLVGIGLTEPPNSGGAKAPPAPPLTTALLYNQVSLTDMDKKSIPLYVLRSDKDLGGSSIFDPWMGQDHFGRKTLTGILHQELGNEVFSLTRDVSPLSMGKIKVTILDGVKQEFLTSITRFSLIPATFNT